MVGDKMSKKTKNLVGKSYTYGTIGKLQQLSNSVQRSDTNATTTGGWFNQLTGLGVQGKDKRLGMQISWVRLLEPDVEELYAMDDVAGRVVSIVPEMGTRNWINIKVGEEDGGNDKKDEIDDEITRLYLKNVLLPAIIVVKLMEGSLVLRLFLKRLS